MSPTGSEGNEKPQDSGAALGVDIRPPKGAADPLRLRLAAVSTRVAPYVVTVDGILMLVVGVYAMIGAFNSFQGEGFLLVVGGLALMLFGSMTILRWNPSLIRTGLVGLTAGYFASALSEFEVATDPCDIGAAVERCAGHLPGGLPWMVYQGPLILAVLLFVFIAFEPALNSKS